MKAKGENPGSAGDTAMRLDKLLWYLRLARTRAVAQAMVAAGTIRIDGRRADRASVAVRSGSLLVLPGPPRVRVLRLVHLPVRRGPPSEAAACYVDIAGDVDIAGGGGATQEFAPPA